MPPKATPEFTATQLLALRGQPDALKTITELLQVKQMGPADHIRTKHEVKLFIETSANQKEAEAIVKRARERRAQQQKQHESARLAQSRGYRAER